jgi:hypothetical protein
LDHRFPEVSPNCSLDVPTLQKQAIQIMWYKDDGELETRGVVGKESQIEPEKVVVGKESQIEPEEVVVGKESQIEPEEVVVGKESQIEPEDVVVGKTLQIDKDIKDLIVSLRKRVEVQEEELSEYYIENDRLRKENEQLAMFKKRKKHKRNKKKRKRNKKKKKKRKLVETDIESEEDDVDEDEPPKKKKKKNPNVKCVGKAFKTFLEELKSRLKDIGTITKTFVAKEVQQDFTDEVIDKKDCLDETEEGILVLKKCYKVYEDCNNGNNKWNGRLRTVLNNMEKRGDILRKSKKGESITFSFK